MAVLDKSKQLKKELTLFNVYTIATGATLSSGFFLLPGLAAASAGPALPLSYLLAALLLVPGLFSKTELATAMPRAGGVYYFLDRSMGPLIGTIGGFGTWVSLILKSAFALIGVGAYLALFLPDTPMQPIAAGFAILFGVINLFGAKKTGSAQGILVVGLLLLVLWFTGIGVFQIKAAHFSGIFYQELNSFMSATGLVVVSYMGLTKVASIAEEVKDPERNLPLGMFLAFGTAILVYFFGTSAMVGVLSAEKLAGDLTPVATVAEVMMGHWGAVLMTVAAVLAFSSVGNAGILSASRYPLAMSRDHMLPRIFGKLGERSTPKYAIYLTVAAILLFVLLFNPTKIAKLASAFQLVMFAFSCLAVIVMRESRIESYDPSYRSPFYPWVQIVGIISPFIFIWEMGWLPVLFTLGLVLIGVAWYYYYARDKVIRDGAIYHIFARLGELRYEGLDRELRGILKEKGLRDQDPFDAVIAGATLIDTKEALNFQEIVEKAAAQFEKRIPGKSDILKEGFLQGTRVGVTPVSHGVALPHMRLPNIDHPEMVIVRSVPGVEIDIDDDFLGKDATKTPVHAFFFLVSPEDNPGQHLRILAQIAGLADEKKFMKQWLSARHEQELKELVLRDDRHLSLTIKSGTLTAEWIGRAIYDLNLPGGCLITMIYREGQMVIPRGRTVLREGDRLTVIGYPDGIRLLYDKYGKPE